MSAPRGPFSDKPSGSPSSSAVGRPIRGSPPRPAMQFHPESILTLDEDAGMAVVMNVMRGLGR